MIASLERAAHPSIDAKVYHGTRSPISNPAAKLRAVPRGRCGVSARSNPVSTPNLSPGFKEELFEIDKNGTIDFLWVGDLTLGLQYGQKRHQFRVFVFDKYAKAVAALDPQGRPIGATISGERDRLEPLLASLFAEQLPPLLVRFRELVSQSPEALRSMGLANYMRLTSMLGAPPKKNPHTLSPTQVLALRAIVSAYDEAVAFELKRWGAESSAKIAKAGIDPVLYGPQTTINSLLRHGYLTLAGTSRHQTERLRKGAFGKFLGGVHHGEYVQQSVVPTQFGRTVAGS